MRSLNARRVFVGLAVGLSAWLALSPLSHAEAPVAAARTEASEVAQVDLEKLFDAVVATIDRHFVDPELLKTLDWQARARAVRPSVVSAGSLADAVALINKLIAELKTSHTELTTPDEHRYYLTLDALNGAPNTRDLIGERFWGASGPYYAGVGLFTANVDGRHFIDGVLEGSPADKAGLKFGDEIVSADGRPFVPIAAFRGKIGSAVDLEVRRERDGETARYRIPVFAIMPTDAFSAATRASARVIETGGRRIGYIHIWAIRNARAFSAALASLDPSLRTGGAREGEPPLDALIVDLRGRVGGDIGTAGRLLDMLGSAERPYWGRRRSLDRSGNDTAPGDQSGAGNGDRPARPFQGQSVILINHQTRSAGEITAHGYKRSRFGLAIGTATAGAVTSGAPFAMQGGLLLYVAVVAHAFDGKPLEGAGVSPDIRVERPLPYAAGSDPVLEAAIEHLAKPNDNSR